MVQTTAIRVDEVREILTAAKSEAVDLELDEDGTRALVTRRLVRTHSELADEQAERLYRIDKGHDVPDDPAEVEQIAIDLVCDHGRWAPEFPEMYAGLARERGEPEVAARQERLLARVLELLAEDAAGDE